jgi:hypothetical protein
MSHEMSHIIELNKVMYKVYSLLDILMLLGIKSAEPPNEPMIVKYIDRLQSHW